MSFAKEFILELNVLEELNLRSHYLKYLNSIPGFVSYESWINCYKDVPYILRSMCK